MRQQMLLALDIHHRGLCDPVRGLIMAAGAKPPLEPHDGDLVVPADPVEQVDEIARVL